MSRNQHPPEQFNKTSLQLLAWSCRRQLAKGSPAGHVLRWVVFQLEQAGGGKLSEERWIEHDIRRKLAEHYVLFWVPKMQPGDYSAVRHTSEHTETGFDTEKSMRYIRERYPDAIIANENPSRFIREMQTKGRDHFTFEGRDPSVVVERLMIKNGSPATKRTDTG